MAAALNYIGVVSNPAVLRRSPRRDAARTGSSGRPDVDLPT